MNHTEDKRKHSVLVVDDTPANVMILEEILSSGYEVRTAEDGPSALEKAAQSPPDLILLDVMMPGMDGYEVCERLKSDPDLKHVPVIFVTALTEEEDEARGLDAGAIDYVTKPFNSDLVLRRVANHLELKGQRDRLADLNRELSGAYEKISREFELVSDLQQRLLPSRPLRVDGLDLKSMYTPSAHAGGDYFDYFRLSSRAVRLIIADVSGHGAEAAFIMGMVRTMFHMGKEHYRDLPSTMELVNSRLCEIIKDSGYFVTALALELNTRLQTLEFVNAGHCPGMLAFPGGEHMKLMAQTPPLGIVEMEFPSNRLSVGKGFDLFMYTDGLYEWVDKDGEYYNLEDFMEMTGAMMRERETMLDSLIPALEREAGAEIAFNDDITAVWAGWRPEEDEELVSVARQKVLVVDDAPLNARILAQAFRDGFEVFVATTGEAGLDIARRENPDIVLLDIKMPGMDGYEVCTRLKRDPATRSIPVIFITAKDDEEDETRGLSLGASDYITKPFSLPIVQARVAAQLELKRKTDKLESLAGRDGLTGIPNRRVFNEYLAEQWVQARTGGQRLAMIMADIDYFKRYNDNYGHLAGDACLQDVAAMLRDTVSGLGGLIARYGGEEFVVLLPGAGREEAMDVAEDIRLELEKLDIEHSHSLAAPRVTMSLGVAAMEPEEGQTPMTLVEAADTMLYRAKDQGRNQVAG